MRIIELCAGYGGLGLGVQIAVPSARVVCAVEREAYTVARQAALALTLLARRAKVTL